MFLHKRGPKLYQFYQKHANSIALNNSLTALKIIHIEQLYVIIFVLLLRYFLSAIIDHLFNAIGINFLLKNKSADTAGALHH